MEFVASHRPMQARHHAASRLHHGTRSSAVIVMLAVIASVSAVVIAAGALYQFVGARHSVRRYAPPGMMLDVGGQHLHVVCAGNGRPTVLFESGIAASSLSWTRVLRDVAAFTHACAYDRAGLGWSEPSRAPRTVAKMVTELRGVLSNT